MVYERGAGYAYITGYLRETTRDLFVEVLELRHESHTFATLAVRFGFARLVAFKNSTSTTVLDMLSQHSQNFRVLPSLRNGTIGRLEETDSLGPLASARRANVLVFGGLALGYGSSLFRTTSFGVFHGSRGGFLCGPVVDVPVVLVKEKVVLLKLLGGHGFEVAIGKGGHEEVTL